MKVTFDIDKLLENIRDVDEDTIVAMIDDENVLDYLASEYIDDENIIFGVVKNSSTSKQTIEFIANKVLESKNTYHHITDILIINRLIYDGRLSQEIRDKLIELPLK